MKPEHFHNFVDYVPIPAVFQSLYHEGPFPNCLVCNRYLLDDEHELSYVIERSFRGTEPIYEFACCLNCQEELCSDMSEETRTRIEAHFDERVDLWDRRAILLQRNAHDVDPWIQHCVLTKKPRSQLQAYTIYGHCQGPDLLFTAFPFMISEEGLTGMNRLLSRKTRDRLDDFTDEFLGLPPEFRETRPVFL